MDEVTFVEEDIGLKFRPVFMEQYPVKAGGEIKECNFWIWFACVIGKDSWFAFKLTEDDNSEGLMDDSDPDELRMMSVWIGCPWDHVASNCAHCVAEKQRDRFNGMDDEIKADIMSTDIERLEYLKEVGAFNAHAHRYNHMTGGKLSLN